jgi:beta-glucanase (GH16 family)
MRLAVFLVAIAGAIAVLNASPGPSEAAEKPLFFDDFSGTALDRSKWNVIVTGQTVNNEQQAYVDSTDTISIAPGRTAAGASNGALVLQPRYRQGFTSLQGRSYDFVSGRIDTRGKFEAAYGTWSARIKLSEGAGFWPAFWALGAGRWPDTGEIDIMENVGARDWTSVALHGPGYSGGTPLVKRVPFEPRKDVTAWHVYSVDWTPDALAFRIDRDVVYRVTKPMVEEHGRWAFDEPKFVILNVAIGGSYPQAVNGARTPYPGLPESTVDLIKSNRLAMTVDWVRVTGKP